MVKVSGKIRRLLIDAGLVTQEEWADARQTGQPVVEVLLERGILFEDRLFEILGRASGMPPVDLTRFRADPQALEALPQEICQEHCVLPIARNGENLTVAVSDPFDVLLLDDLNILSSCRVRPVVALPGAIRQSIVTVYERDKREVEELLDGVGDTDLTVSEDRETDDLSIAGEDRDDVPAVKLVNLMILRALREKASDIHIEPMDKSLRIRHRIDGRLIEAMTPPKSLLGAVISRLKILANLDISVHFEPQDGKFQIKYEGRRIDFRLSTLPVVGGEKAVLRILDGSNVSPSLEGLGFEPRCLGDFAGAASAAYGMVLVTGPTGSGKSTTLYAAVKEIDSSEINVVTVEDPVEYRMNGINQVPVNPKRGLTFAGALRSILRQDPDVVLIGEIRDRETAEIAIKAALTGHLVLSTLHTNDAVQALTRLMDMGIDPFLVSSSLLCVAAQRLVRKLCSHCRESIELPKKELLSVGFIETELDDLQLYGPHKRGCPRCMSGYRGRLAVVETLSLSEALKRMIVEGRSVQDLKKQAIKEGMLTLRRVGLLNAMRGKTSLEEVLRVTLAD
ncbi:MAG: type II secretion system protein GspE [Planctomycetes bacterium]|jgi:type IV pilus assembly protein PilB|nr:type II secretion system protein GspE [Planctomycetota bacterium]